MVPFKEYRMSTLQVVSLSGIVMGCMLCAFYLGAYFGNKIGFDNAMEENKKNLAKVPIDSLDTGRDEVDEKTVSKVYEKLRKDSLSDDIDNDLPSLNDIANGKEDDDSVDIIKNEKVPNLIENAGKKTVGEIVEDVQIAKGNENKKEKIAKGSDKNDYNSDVKLVVGSLNQDEKSIKNEIENVRKTAEEEFEKSKNEVQEDVEKEEEKIDVLNVKNSNQDKLVIKKDVNVNDEKNKENKSAPTINVGGEQKQVVIAKPERIDTPNIKKEEVTIKREDVNNNIQNNFGAQRPSIEPKLPNNNQGLNLPQNRPANINANLPSQIANQRGGVLPSLPNNPQNNMPNVEQNNPIKANIQNGSSYIPKGFYAQIASTEKEQDATELAKKIRDSGFKAVIEQTQVNGTRYYRVLTGPEDTRGHANRLVDQLKREPYVSTSPFVKEVR